jgi:hypothetical protein
MAGLKLTMATLHKELMAQYREEMKAAKICLGRAKGIKELELAIEETVRALYHLHAARVLHEMSSFLEDRFSQ